MIREDLTKVTLEVPTYLVEAIRDARKAKKRYKGALYSNPLCFIIGAKVLSGLGEEEEEFLDQKLSDIQIQRALLDSEERMLLEQKKVNKAESQVKEAEISKRQQDIERLASMIVDKYKKITLNGRKENIGFIVAAFPDKLTKDKVAAVFAGKFNEETVPTYEMALKIAADLLYPDSEV
jgi:hypothetical protein